MLADFLIYEGRQQRRHVQTKRESIFFELLQLVFLYPDSEHCLVLVSLIRCHGFVVDGLTLSGVASPVKPFFIIFIKNIFKLYLIP